MAGNTEPRTAAAAAQPTILLVDGDVLVRAPLADYLRLCGYRVLEALSAAEAKCLLQSDETRIDLLFTDAELAGEANGFALASWVRRNRPDDVRVILAAGVVSAAQKAGEACEDGPQLCRPYSHELVLARIRQLLRRAGRPAAEG